MLEVAPSFFTQPLVVFKPAYFLLIRANGLLFGESTGKKAGHVVAICEEWCMWRRGRQEERGKSGLQPRCSHPSLCAYSCVNALMRANQCACGSGNERREQRVKFIML